MGDTGPSHAFLYSNGKIIDLGTLPGPPCCGDINSGSAINNVGEVAGYAYEGVYAFLYSNGQMTNVGTLGGSGGTLANGIDDIRQVVGPSGTSGGSNHAFLYSNGQILAEGAPSSDPFAIRPYLLTSVPEPSTLALLAVASTYCAFLQIRLR